MAEQLGSINLVNTSVSQQHEVKKRKKEATNAGFQWLRSTSESFSKPVRDFKQL